MTEAQMDRFEDFKRATFKKPMRDVGFHSFYSLFIQKIIFSTEEVGTSMKLKLLIIVLL